MRMHFEQNIMMLWRHSLTYFDSVRSDWFTALSGKELAAPCTSMKDDDKIRNSDKILVIDFQA